MTGPDQLTGPDPTAGAALFERLSQLGVELVVVNSGTDFPPVIEGLAEAAASSERRSRAVPPPRTVLAGHEHVALGMAHGWYLATGRPAAVLLHTNVGLANGSIGAINAAVDRVPVLLMSGRTPTLEAGRFGARTVPVGWGQEMRDQTALVREACKWDYELRFPEQVPSLLDRAHAIATSSPPGPVYLSLPREVLCQPCPRGELDRAPAMEAARSDPVPDRIEEVAELLAGAERPLVVAQRGAGTAEGFGALSRLAERWAVPVCQYWAVATAVPTDHPMAVGSEPDPWLAEADVVVVLDALAPWAPEHHAPAPGATVVHLGPDPLEARVPVRGFPSHLTVTADTGPALVALEAALVRRGQPGSAVDGRRDRVARRLSRLLADRRRDRPVTVLSELGCPLDHLTLSTHGSYRQEPHAGGLGWSLPCGLGMALADPDRLVVATMGDGSYIFANPVACHQVAEAAGIALLTVVLNDGGYGAVRRSVTELYPDGYAAKENGIPLTGLAPSPDFTLVAAASRAHAESVDRAGDLDGALERALSAVTEHGRQALLDIHIDPA